MKSVYDDDDEDFPINPKKEILKLACCDCGLVHQIEFKVTKKGVVVVKMRRDGRATGQFRRQHYEYVRIT